MRSDFNDSDLYAANDPELTMTDAELERRHGDDKAHPIAVWREEFQNGKTLLAYIDWRADRKFYRVR